MLTQTQSRPSIFSVIGRIFGAMLFNGVTMFMYTGALLVVMCIGLAYLLQDFYPNFLFWADVLLFLLIVGHYIQGQEAIGFDRWFDRIPDYGSIVLLYGAVFLFLLGLSVLQERFIGMPIPVRTLVEGSIFILLLFIASYMYRSFSGMIFD